MKWGPEFLILETDKLVGVSLSAELRVMRFSPKGYAGLYGLYGGKVHRYVRGYHARGTRVFDSSEPNCCLCYRRLRAPIKAHPDHANKMMNDTSISSVEWGKPTSTVSPDLALVHCSVWPTAWVLLSKKFEGTVIWTE